MPRPASLETQIKQLTKDLNLCRGTIRDNHAKIEDLEKRLASATEHATALEDKVQNLDLAWKKNEHLQQRIVDLEAAITNERGLREDMTKDYLATIKEKSRELFEHRRCLFAANKSLLKQQEQNIALRKALKEVL